MHSSSTLNLSFNNFPECIAKRALLQGRQAIGTLSRITNQSENEDEERESVYPYNMYLSGVVAQCLTANLHTSGKGTTVVGCMPFCLSWIPNNSLGKYTCNLNVSVCPVFGGKSSKAQRPQSLIDCFLDLLGRSPTFIQCLPQAHLWNTEHENEY